jgi:hypothetical protein
MTPIYLTIFIAVITILIAYFNLKTSRDKLRLDLYNKRFEIYSKLIDLFLELPDSKEIDAMSHDEKNSFEEYKKLKRNFVKYYRESKFLFKDDSGVHSNIEDVLHKINTVINGKENTKILRDSGLPVNSLIKEIEKINSARSSIEEKMSSLESAMKPYLTFDDEFRDIVIDFFEKSYIELQKYWNKLSNRKCNKPNL